MTLEIILKSGACRGLANTEPGGERYSTFFPRSETKQDSTSAKAICEQCPVKIDCLDFAIDNGERFGVWGGMTDRERRIERQRRLKESA